MSKKTPRLHDPANYTTVPEVLRYAGELEEQIEAMERVLGCLLDHYLTCYRQNDGEENFHLRDQLGQAAEELVPEWRKRRDEWKPGGKP